MGVASNDNWYNLRAPTPIARCRAAGRPYVAPVLPAAKGMGAEVI